MNTFYEKNHQQYFQTTVNIDSTPFLEPLSLLLQPRAEILDIGCGSGRDLLWFRRKGFSVTGFEKSPSLANLARQHSHCPVIEGDFCNYDFTAQSVDALIFIGSLVHQPNNAIPAILKSTCQALVAGGYILITMKEGTGTYSTPDGRKFTLWGKNNLEDLFIDCSLNIVDFSRQVSSLRPEDIWLGYVLEYCPIKKVDTSQRCE